MFGGKTKAITFSYDDGVTQDRRLIKILDKYGLKCTFNLNSNKFGEAATLFSKKTGVTVPHCKSTVAEIADIYAGHEIAAHTLDHPLLTMLDESEVIRQIEEDRKCLEGICGYDVVGMAYPCGGVNNDDRVAAIVRDSTKIKYARTISDNYSFDPQSNLYRFDPTVRHGNWNKLFELADEFLALPEVCETPKLFYIWGHSYELDFDDSWDLFEKFCQKISGRDDVFYGTNREILL